MAFTIVFVANGANRFLTWGRYMERGLSFGEFFSGNYNNREHEGIPWPYLADGRMNPEYVKFCKHKKKGIMP